MPKFPNLSGVGLPRGALPRVDSPVGISWFLTQKCKNVGSLTTINGYSRVSGKFLVGINRHEQDHKSITSVTNIRTHCTDKLCDSPTKYWEESHVSDTHKKNACSQSFIIAFSRVFVRYVKKISDAKVQKFWLALSARSISFFSSFLFSSQYNEQDHNHECYEHSHGHIVPTNSDLSTMYNILRFEKNRIYVFNADILKNRLARFARSQSCIHFLQFPTRRDSIRPLSWT